MARTYIIRRGDTLAKIARKFYGNATLYQKLALYNGLLDASKILAGQRLEVPAKAELVGAPAPVPSSPPSRATTRSGAAAAPAPALAPPHGLAQIIQVFGDIHRFIRPDGSLDAGFETQYLARAPLPFAIPLSWDRSKQVSRLYCHVRLASVFQAVFADIVRRGAQQHVRTFGGCFNYRAKRTSGKLSTHCWGIAIDLNPETNAQGTAGDMHPDIVAAFRSFGLKWGGDWTGPSRDPMHFQFCTGY